MDIISKYSSTSGGYIPAELEEFISQIIMLARSQGRYLLDSQIASYIPEEIVDPVNFEMILSDLYAEGVRIELDSSAEYLDVHDQRACILWHLRKSIEREIELNTCPQKLSTRFEKHSAAGSHAKDKESISKLEGLRSSLQTEVMQFKCSRAKIIESLREWHQGARPLTSIFARFPAKGMFATAPESDPDGEPVDSLSEDRMSLFFHLIQSIESMKDICLHPEPHFFGASAGGGIDSAMSKKAARIIRILPFSYEMLFDCLNSLTEELEAPLRHIKKYEEISRQQLGLSRDEFRKQLALHGSNLDWMLDVLMANVNMRLVYSSSEHELHALQRELFSIEREFGMGILSFFDREKKIHDQIAELRTLVGYFFQRALTSMEIEATSSLSHELFIIDEEDRFQNGAISLFSGIDSYVEHLELEFPDFAWRWVSRGIFIPDHVMWPKLYISIDLLLQYSHFSWCVKARGQQLGRSPRASDFENFEDEDLSFPLPWRALEMLALEKALFAKSFDDDLDSLSLDQSVIENNSDPLVLIERIDLVWHLEASLRTLNRTERFVLCHYFGIPKDESLTFEEIAKKGGMSTLKTRSVWVKAMRKLRHPNRVGGLRDFK